MSDVNGITLQIHRFTAGRKKSSWLECSVSNTRVLGWIPFLTTHLRGGLDDLCEFLPTQNILWFFYLQQYWWAMEDWIGSKVWLF